MALYLYYTKYLYFAIAGILIISILNYLKKLKIDKTLIGNYKITSANLVDVY